jgi:Rrf2 family protein
MNKMNKKMEYALMALNLIAMKPPEQLTSAKEVAEKIHISFEMTARVLQALSARGLLRAEYGMGGGYALARPLSQVSLHDLSEMLDGHTLLTKCLEDGESCETASTCNIAVPITRLNKKIQDFYKSISLQEVLHV